MLISISTNKGGAGKTTIATNLAASIAKLCPDKSVVLIDLDGQCGVSITFGKSPKKYADKSILSFINKTASLEDVVDKNPLPEVLENLYVIYSEPTLRAFDHLVSENVELQDNLFKTMDFLKDNFDYIIVDTPPTFSTLNVMTFMKSDIIVSPFEPERQNIEGALAVINELQKQQYKNNPYIYLLPIKVRERTLIDRALLEYIDSVVNIEHKDNPKILISEYKIPNSTQYKSVSAKEKLPLIISNAKAKAVHAQKELIIDITKDIINLGNVSSNKKEIASAEIKKSTDEEEIKQVQEITTNEISKANPLSVEKIENDNSIKTKSQDPTALLRVDNILKDDKYEKLLDEISNKYNKKKK